MESRQSPGAKRRYEPYWRVEPLDCPFYLNMQICARKGAEIKRKATQQQQQQE